MNPIERDYRDYFSVCFRIAGDDLNPSKVTELLVIEPHHAHRKGDPNTGKAKSGKIIYYAPFRTGLWSINSNLDKHCRLHEHFIYLLERLEPHKDALEEIRKNGFELDFSCGHFFADESQPGYSLTNDILIRIGALGIDLNICLYPQRLE